MIHLYELNTDILLGTITVDQLQFLIDNMEEESTEDIDYAVTRMTIDYLEGQGADPELIELLRQALGPKEEIVIYWTTTD